MTKELALTHAIELAKAAIESPSSNAMVYPNKASAEDVAAFIQTLTERLASPSLRFSQNFSTHLACYSQHKTPRHSTTLRNSLRNILR